MVSWLRWSYWLWVLPPLIAATFLLVVRVLPREYRLFAQHFFFTELFWLALPYALWAMVCAVAALRARRWLSSLGALIVFTVAVTALYARFVEPGQLHVRETSLRVGAPLRIALIADLHIGLFQGRERTQQIAEALNRLDVDVVVVAGDWTYEPTRPLAELLAPMSRVKHRVLSVPGNHDEEMPGPPLGTELRAALIAHRVEPIEGKVVTIKGVRFAGMGDRWARKDFLPDLDDTSTPLVALAHNPESIDRLRGTPIHTMLSGHTHGGQINLPVLTAHVLKAATKQGFKAGLYAFDDKQVFVTSGLGMIGLPLRLFQLPVIDVITFY
ncbi:MAG TPA: metallophosphoesterase [Casimicrobium sp.]|nr:metallophosphoesterase [Casimicrobium sp.]